MNNDPHDTIFPLPVWFIVVVTILYGCPITASAEPMYQTSLQDGLTITLYSEPCALKEVVNLPKRATWDEKGKLFEGCWGVSPFGVAMFYFEDKTMAVIPAEAFKKVVGI